MCASWTARASKRLSKFNELIAGVRDAVPDMIIQVGGSISFAPESDGAAAKWLSDDTRHMLADLDPKPDQVTVAINTTQMNIVELMDPTTSPARRSATRRSTRPTREMIVPAGPAGSKSTCAACRPPASRAHFQLDDIAQLETSSG